MKVTIHDIETDDTVTLNSEEQALEEGYLSLYRTVCHFDDVICMGMIVAMPVRS